MAEELIKAKTIITNEEVFPSYLNFDKLRKEGIEHLGKLSGKIWTDHNVHDPGITILEILCYAILDLGYRTNLPATDLFSPDPNNPSQPGFFTPAKILSNNPLTITDFRKMLIDIPGINNAWLEIDEKFDVESNVGGQTIAACQKRDTEKEAPIHYLNGLYKVFVELEEYPENEAEKKKHEEQMIGEVRKALMAHRNFCEDFSSIKVLCREPIGICADIELQDGANPEVVYLAIMNAVRDFLSPQPKFYSLETLLLEKNKSIESIFAGRPYNVKKGHGFVDSDEFENLELKKKIYLSDLYNVMNKVEGILRVNKLRFNKCKDQKGEAKSWFYVLPKDHIPSLKLDCTGISFTSKSIPVVFDAKKFEEILSFNFRNNGKIFYEQSVPYLDAAIPRGVYRSELKEYVSIQTEFPKVYGITEGGLPENAGVKRKVQSLQLKGYLFFFDRLLADYVAQLQHMSSLFSSAPAQTTYASGLPAMVSSMEELVRYNSGSVQNILGKSGSLLAIPVDKKEIDKLIKEDKLHKLELEKIKPYRFPTKTAAEIAISQLKQDIGLQEYSATIITKKDECVFYYIFTSSDDFALIGKKYFSTEADAKLVTDALKYAGGFRENYKIYLKQGPYVSFGLEMNMAAYPKYLKSITEDKELFFERRKSFLDHLLLRFAEQFTDFSLKSYVSCTSNQPAVNELQVKEAMLASYDKLSANRGKGYDYLKNRWNNKNVSGFEKRFKALAGIDEWGKHYLSHIEIVKHPIEYIYTLKLGDREIVTSQEKFTSREEAQKALHTLFNSRFSGTDWKEPEIDSDKIFDSAHNYSAVIKSVADDKEVFVYFEPHTDIVKAEKSVQKNISATTNKKTWIPQKDARLPAGKLLVGSTEKMPVHFLDDAMFKVNPLNTRRGKPNEHRYILLEKDHRFRFKPLQPLKDTETANSHANELKVLLIDEANYEVKPAKETGKAYVQINRKGQPFAVSDPYQVQADHERSEIERIRKIISEYEYITDIKKEARAWDFSYQLSFEPHEQYVFKTNHHFPDKATAAAKAKDFYTNPDNLGVISKDNKLFLEYASGDETISAAFNNEENEEAATKETAARQLLQIRKEIKQYREAQQPADFDHFVKEDPTYDNRFFSYRLVNKDGLYAYYKDKGLDSEKQANASLQTVIETFTKGYNYLEIDRKANNFLKRQDDCKRYWYHFRVQSLNRISRPGHKNEEKQLILFEGVRGYTSQDEAQQKFASDWHDLLHKAADKENYGEGQLISLREMLIQAGNYVGADKPKVFIPADTLKWLAETEEEAIEEMIRLVKSYPVQYLQAEKDCFKKEEEKKEYYFVLFNRKTNETDWHSNKYYKSFDKALKDFNHFYFLLRYKGNYTTACDHNGDYRLFVREVLAESKGRFAEEDVWGATGVEKFIAVAQSCYSFHHYISHDCCHTFDIACGKFPFYHPCKYDTPEERDAVIKDMCRHWETFISKQPFKVYDESGEMQIKDLNGNFLASIYIDRRFITGTFCDLMGLVDAINLGDFRSNTRELFYKEKRIAEPVSPDMDFAQWQYFMSEFAWYFPIINEGRDEATRDSGKFCLEIKIPGFNQYRDADHLDKNQSADDLQRENCFLAWKSACCFDSCLKAYEEFKKLVPVLSDCLNYQPVYDCPCGSFGIDLYNRRLPDTDAYGIVAYNPQCYDSMEMACEAAELARSLINSEGLHVVEHILLRPRCPEHYESRLQPARPQQFEGCDFQWKQDAGDPCKKDKNICFVPGYDPYSFLATIALPAWPERFRTKENRLLIEDRLRREAPAHVLLRILWLGPKDFDAFETSYKGWNHWLTGKEKCTENFSFTAFIDLLFRSEFKEMTAISDCSCEEEKNPVPQKCNWEDQPQDCCDTISFQTQLDDLFRWKIEKIAEQQPWSEADRNQKIQDRHQQYSMIIERLLEKLAAYPDVKKMLEQSMSGLIKKQVITKDRIERYIRDITRKESYAQLKKVYTDTEIGELTRLPLLYYIDSIALDKEMYNDRKEELKSTLVSARDMLDKDIRQQIYEKWNAPEAIRINPQINYRDIKCWLTENNS